MITSFSLKENLAFKTLSKSITGKQKSQIMTKREHCCHFVLAEPESVPKYYPGKTKGSTKP